MLFWGGFAISGKGDHKIFLVPSRGFSVGWKMAAIRWEKSMFQSITF